MLAWKYIIVLDIKEKHNYNLFFYINIVEIPTREQTLTLLNVRRFSLYVSLGSRVLHFQYVFMLLTLMILLVISSWLEGIRKQFTCKYVCCV